MCNFKIKHYWDEETAEATIEPSWITSSSDNLTKEQQKIKILVKEKLLNRYKDLSTNKPKKEIFENYIFTYLYKTKKDPYPNRDRMVTDITLCIKIKKNYNLYFILILIFILIGGYLLLNNKKPQKEIVIVNDYKIENSKKDDKKDEFKKIEQKQAIEKPKQKNNEILPPPKVKLNKLDILREKVCKKNEFNVKLADKCWQYFIQNKCDKKTDLSYNNWLKNSDIIECTTIKDLKTDSDWLDFIKKQKKDKKDMMKFMGDKYK